MSGHMETPTTELQVALMNCLHIADDKERLARYDKAATQSSEPFKGGPLFFNYSRAEVEDAGCEGFPLSGNRLPQTLTLSRLNSVSFDTHDKS